MAPSFPPSAIHSARRRPSSSTVAPPGGKCHRLPRVGEDRRRLHDTGAGGRCVSCIGMPMPRSGPTSSTAIAGSPRSIPTGNGRSSISAPAMSGISRAATAIRSRGWGREAAPSCWCSTTAISRSSARSRSRTGWDTRRPRCSQGISACRSRPSPTSRRRKSISPPARSRRRSRKTPRRDRRTSRRSRTAIVCWRPSRKSSRAAACAGSRPASSQSRRR
jgi:hypothetical protein